MLHKVFMVILKYFPLWLELYEMVAGHISLKSEQ